jgi:transcriptional regulator with XRE-family HTH domain
VTVIAPVFVYRDDTNTWVPTNETLTRTEVAKRFGVSRTTLWRYETQIVEKANILDFYRYVKAHPKELDWYCIAVLYRAIEHLKGEGSYQAAAEVMKAQRALYSRQAYDAYVQSLVQNQTKPNPKRRNAA